MNWREKNKDLGILKESSSYQIEYEFTGILKKVLKFNVSCEQCTKLLGFDGRLLEVKYTTNKLPKHLRISEQKILKTIEVIYEDGEKDVLSFTGIIKKK